MQRSSLIAELDQLLESPRYRDYGPNGLQVEGSDEVTHVATATTASLAACQAAIDAGADALLVHHGIIWGMSPIVGMMAGRVRTLMKGDCNLIAYHLPLDAAAEVGNNAVALKALGADDTGTFAPHKGSDIGRMGTLAQALDVGAFAERCHKAFDHEVITCPGDGRQIRTIGVVTGGGQSHHLDAMLAGCDCLVTGETSEQSWHEAAETGVALFACGHHATEALAVHALGEAMAAKHGIEHTGLHLTNPL